MMRAFLTCAATALTIGASALAAGAQTPAEINFGVISTEASMNQKKNWEPFLQAMSKAVGIKVNGFYATDYAGVIEAMRFNKIHLAWYGNKSGMEAVDRANGEVFAQIDGPRRQRRLLLPYHRAQGQPLHEDRGHPEVRQVARFRHRRSELDVGLPGADLVHLRGAKPRPEDLLQDRAQRQSPGERHGGRQQAGRRRDQQQRGPAARGDLVAGRARADQDHLDLAAHSARPARVAQGPRSGGQDQALHVPDELWPHRLGRRDQEPPKAFSAISSGRRSGPRPTIS